MTAQPTVLSEGVFAPGQPPYEAAARMFFSTAAPSLVIQPGNAAAVADALRDPAFRANTIAIRSGGHDPLHHRDDRRSLLIDLKRLDHVEVLDRSRRLVRVGGGATWGRVGAVLDPYGWGLTAGDTADVGVGGLTLGGGFGWMVRRYGLAIDNLVGARIVTADGRILRISADDHADLFWAIRGGGGNFGVVVDFDFIAQPVAGVHFGSVTYQDDDPAVVLASWREVMRHAPEELSSTLMLPPRTPDRPAAVTVGFCYAHDQQVASDAERAIQPLLELGSVTAKSIRHCRYAETLEAAGSPPPFDVFPRSSLVDNLDRAVIERVCSLHRSRTPTAIAVRSLGGAFSRVSPEATAFAHRNAEAMIVALLMSPDPSTDLEEAGTLQDWEQLADLGSGTYLNFTGSSTASDLASAYPAETYRRLAEIKRRYDPDNRFEHNHNIPPQRPATFHGDLTKDDER